MTQRRPGRESRREFLRQASFWGAAIAAADSVGPRRDGASAKAQDKGGAAVERAVQDARVEILHPRARVPASFIIDDSTCLVNMGHFCMPQFAAAWPDREAYRRPWETWPREIPDAFVREFGEWCGEHGVRGKYSIVPYPACVGWLDRELPGWSRRQLQDSLRLVRELMSPNWDIHPEMITHTRVIDLTTGRPLAEIDSSTMENSYPQRALSVDQMADYMAYALRILRNCDLPCEGITTPGGFGNRVKSELSQGVRQAVLDVFPQVDVPHYFKYVKEGQDGTMPTLEQVRGVETTRPEFVVNVPAGTGDWFGGWDGDQVSAGEKYASADGRRGRLVELIQRNEPAVMLCHWPGLYSHGSKAGFHDFQRVIRSLEEHFPERLLWQKPSELARYAAARQLTQIEANDAQVTFHAPTACRDFTVRLRGPWRPPFQRGRQGERQPLEESLDLRRLREGTFCRDGESYVVCLQLAQGVTTLSALTERK